MTKTLYALFETDESLETKGIVLKFGPAKFHVKRAGGANREFDAAYEEATRSLNNRLQLNALSNEEADEILWAVYAKTVVTGWEGVTDRKGNVLEFNAENFRTVMKDLPTLWKALRAECANHENFLRAQAQQEGERLGNS